MPVGLSLFEVGDIEHFEHVPDDRDVGRVGALGQVVCPAHGVEERSI